MRNIKSTKATKDISFLKHLNENVELFQIEQKMNNLYVFIIGNIGERYSAVKTNDLNNYDKFIYCHSLDTQVGKIQEPQNLNGIQISIVNYNKPEMGITCDVRLPNKIIGRFIEKTGKFASLDLLSEFLVDLLIELKQIYSVGQ